MSPDLDIDSIIDLAPNYHLLPGIGYTSYQHTVGTNLRHDYSPNIYNISAWCRLTSQHPIGQRFLDLIPIGWVLNILWIGIDMHNYLWTLFCNKLNPN